MIQFKDFEPACEVDPSLDLFEVAKKICDEKMGQDKDLLGVVCVGTEVEDRGDLALERTEC